MADDGWPENWVETPLARDGDDLRELFGTPDPDHQWVTLGATGDGYRLTCYDDGSIDRVHRAHSEPLWTVGDALDFLDPAPPRRTVQRWVEAIEPAGERELPQGGPPARLYPVTEVMKAHAEWRPRRSWRMD